MANKRKVTRSGDTAATTRAFFDRRFRRYGDSPSTLGWGKTSQAKRFEVFAGLGPLTGASVLDLGCGLGHFRDYLTARAIPADYTGVDLSPRMIRAAARRLPGTQFQVRDVLRDGVGSTADYVVASGVLNLETGTNESDMRRFLRAAFGACRRAAAVNMLSAWADWRDRGRHYYDPFKIARFARSLTRSIVLRHDYLPHDFTVYMYRPPHEDVPPGGTVRARR